MALFAQSRQTARRIASSVVAAVARTGISPNALTVVGVVVVVAGSALVLVDVRLAGAVILLGALLDALDGAVARHTQRTTTFGSFLDSVTDRVADAAMIGAVAWVVRDEPALVAVAFLAMVLALLTSYLRAKAESLGLTARVGLLQRAERVVLIGVGLLLGPVWMPLVLGLLVAGGAWTVVARLHTVWRQTQQGHAARRSRR